MSSAQEPAADRPTKAMVLAAGLGTRLRPLTESVPKALLPIASVPIIRYALKLLASHGVTEVMVNLHWLPDEVEAELGRRAEGLQIHYSREPTILGTGGAIRKVAGFFDRPFYVINADTVIDLDLGALLETHRRAEAIATMVLMERRKGDTYTPVGVDENGLVRQIGDHVAYTGPPLKQHLFTGVHLLEPEVIEYIPPDIESCINRYAYPKVIAAGRRVAAHLYRGCWSDVGTLERYWQVNVDLLRRRTQLAFFDPLAQFAHTPRKDVDDVIRLGEKSFLGEGARLTPPVIAADGARILDGAEVGPEVVLGTGAVVGKGARLAHAIVLPGAKIEANTEIDGAVIAKKMVVPLKTAPAS
ncbi:MAG: NDP-sugar synthase [Deltaproteobacteria bacterium]|nr:NDP-sugar synthase [Deltaproteobacteria bacterium]